MLIIAYILISDVNRNVQHTHLEHEYAGWLSNVIIKYDISTVSMIWKDVYRRVSHL